MRRIFLTLAALALTFGCGQPSGEIVQLVERNPGDEPRVFGPDGIPAVRGPGDGDSGDGDMGGDGDSGGDGDTGDGDVSGDGDIGGDGDGRVGDGDVGGDGDFGDGDSEPEPEPDYPPPPPPPTECGYEWFFGSFDFVWDDAGCEGPQLVRYDALQGLWVGLIFCEEWLTQRLYLSADLGDTFYAASDWAGHGQDQCELINPEFFLSNEDDITSGNCPDCFTGEMAAIEYGSTWSRGYYGQQFEFIEQTPEWGYLVSPLHCGIDPMYCVLDD